MSCSHVCLRMNVNWTHIISCHDSCLKSFKVNLESRPPADRYELSWKKNLSMAVFIGWNPDFFYPYKWSDMGPRITTWLWVPTSTHSGVHRFSILMELRVLRATNIGLIFDLSVRHKGWNTYQTVETCVQGAAIDRVGRKPTFFRETWKRIKCIKEQKQCPVLHWISVCPDSGIT